MATTNKRLCSGTFSATNSTLYTAPAATGNFTIVKAVTLCNKTATPTTVTLKFAGIEVICMHIIRAYDTVTIPFIDHVLQSGELLEGSAGATSAINYYISGKEVT